MSCTCPQLHQLTQIQLPPTVPFHHNIVRSLHPFQRTTAALWLYSTHPAIGFGIPLATLFTNPCPILQQQRSSKLSSSVLDTHKMADDS